MDTNVSFQRDASLAVNNGREAKREGNNLVFKNCPVSRLDLAEQKLYMKDYYFFTLEKIAKKAFDSFEEHYELKEPTNTFNVYYSTPFDEALYILPESEQNLYKKYIDYWNEHIKTLTYMELENCAIDYIYQNRIFIIYKENQYLEKIVLALVDLQNKKILR